MKTYLVRYFVLTVSMTLLSVAAAEDYAVRTLKSNMVPMRDGVRLATHIYRPKDSGSNPVPTIFVKTPYNMNLWGNGEMNVGRFRGPLEAVRRGYAYVNQNERGKFFSEGECLYAKSKWTAILGLVMRIFWHLLTK